MNASDSTELLAGLLGFAAGVIFDHYLTPSVRCYSVPVRAQTHRIPVESSGYRKSAIEPPPTTMSNSMNKLPTDAQNIAALQSLLQAQQSQALTAAYTGVAIGVLAVSAGVAIALLPKLMKNNKRRMNPQRSSPLQQQQPPPQPQPQPQPQLAPSPSTAAYAPIQGTAPAASYPTTYSL